MIEIQAKPPKPGTEVNPESQRQRPQKQYETRIQKHIID